MSVSVIGDDIFNLAFDLIIPANLADMHEQTRIIAKGVTVLPDWFRTS